MNTPRPLQVQVEAARFASRADKLEAARRRSVQAAITHLVAGDGYDVALEAMFSGVREVAPLSFRPTMVTT